ncbi:hypothetical protein PMIN03_012651 [Paraphaeosphaeria minitans]
MGAADEATEAALTDETGEAELNATDAGLGVRNELGSNVLATPTGIKAIRPLVIPSVAPSAVPNPPTKSPTTPVTPFSRQEFVALSYVAPTQ